MLEPQTASEFHFRATAATANDFQHFFRLHSILPRSLYVRFCAMIGRKKSCWRGETLSSIGGVPHTADDNDDGSSTEEKHKRATQLKLKIAC